jgi:replicative DNA helicase
MDNQHTKQENFECCPSYELECAMNTVREEMNETKIEVDAMVRDYLSIISENARLKTLVQTLMKQNRTLQDRITSIAKLAN